MIAGGYSSNTNDEASVTVLDLAAGVWSTKSPLPRPNACPQIDIITYQGRPHVVLAGGYVHGASPVQQAFSSIYDVAADAWTQLDDLPFRSTAASSS